MPERSRPPVPAGAFAALLAALLVLATACGAPPEGSLAAAAEAGDRPAVVRLLAAGADPNELDGQGSSPLIRAVRAGHFKLVSPMVSRGADPDLRDADGGWTPLLHAIRRRDMDAVRALLNSGADPNVASSGGRTPLMMAAGYGYVRITRLLLERGADPRAASPSGETALEEALLGAVELDHVTVASCQTEIVRLLLDAAPELELEEGSWALRLARLKRCREIVEMLTGDDAGD